MHNWLEYTNTIASNQRTEKCLTDYAISVSSFEQQKNNHVFQTFSDSFRKCS